MREIAIYIVALVFVAAIVPLLASRIAEQNAPRGPFDCGPGYIVAGCWSK